ADLKLVAPGCEACTDPDSSTSVGILSTFVSPMVTTNDGRKIAALRADYSDAALKSLTFSACPPNTAGISSTFVVCGFGGAADFPASVKGKIALVSRGNSITFIDKASNAAKAG